MKLNNDEQKNFFAFFLKKNNTLFPWPYLLFIDFSFIAYRYRWEKLEENLKLGQNVVKRVTRTSWANYYNACSVVTNAQKEFMKVLLEIQNNKS